MVLRRARKVEQTAAEVQQQREKEQLQFQRGGIRVCPTCGRDWPIQAVGPGGSAGNAQPTPTFDHWSPQV